MSLQTKAPVQRTSRSKGFIYIVLWGYALVAIFPFFIMISNSLRGTREMAMDPLGLPIPPNVDSYISAWETASFDKYFFNSTIVSISSVLITATVSVFAAYAFARTRSKIIKSIEMVFISGLMMPIHLAILPLFYFLDSFRLTNNLGILILVYAANGIPFTAFVLSAFVRNLPNELEEAAYLDGAGPFRTFVYIMLPLLRPALATVIVFRFVPVWNDFFYPLILIRDPNLYTLPVGLTKFFGEYATDWSGLFAGLTIATVPLVLVFLFSTRHIISGLTAGISK